MVNIKRIRIYPLSVAAGTLKAKADVTLEIDSWEMGINGCRIIKPEGKDPWVGFPQERYHTKGRDHYKEIIYLNSVSRTEISKEIISEYFKLINKNNNSQT